ncbi:MAG: lipopolysaccharide heptosyltransferase II [Sphingobacteriaceae bacterium]
MKILLRLPNWLGDLVMSTAFVTAVQQHYPGAEIHAIVKKELMEIVQLMPAIHTIHPFSKREFKGLQGILRFGKLMRKENFNLFFSLPDSFSSALIGWATSSKKRIGFRKEGRAFLMTNTYDKPKNLHRVDEYMTLLERYTGKTVGHPSVQLKPEGLVQKSKDFILINFNSEADSRRMPLEKGQILLSKIIAALPNTTFGFIGTPKESTFVNEIIQGIPQSARLLNYSGSTSLNELVDLMANATLVLTTDSGPAHLANSIGTPVIVLFGAGDERNTAPYNKQNLHIIRSGKLSCEPCIKNTCVLYGVPKCMELLDEEKILEQIYLYRTDA